MLLHPLTPNRWCYSQLGGFHTNPSPTHSDTILDVLMVTSQTPDCLEERFLCGSFNQLPQSRGQPSHLSHSFLKAYTAVLFQGLPCLPGAWVMAVVTH